MPPYPPPARRTRSVHPPPAGADFLTRRETVDSIQETLAGLHEPLSSPKAMHILSPRRGEGFTMEKFLEKPNIM
jgi:hypothetical protein